MITATGIWGSEEATKSGYPHNDRLRDKLCAVFEKSKTIRDFGCGDGYYMAHLQQQGFQVFGYDGFIPESHKLPGLCTTLDLSTELPLFFRGQVLSLEVGEHIPAEYEDNFLNNLSKSCETRMVLSWAIPGQGGIGHVNCRENQYIVDKLIRRGLILNARLTEYLRMDTPMEVKYFENTLMVFDRF